METMKLKQHLAGAVSMLLGLILVFGLIFWMNRYSGETEKKTAQEVTDIAMVREIKPEPKKEIKKAEPKKTARPQQAAAPFKGFGAALSGIDMGSLGLDDGQGRSLDRGRQPDGRQRRGQRDRRRNRRLRPAPDVQGGPSSGLVGASAVSARASAER